MLPSHSMGSCYNQGKTCVLTLSSIMHTKPHLQLATVLCTWNVWFTFQSTQKLAAVKHVSSSYLAKAFCGTSTKKWKSIEQVWPHLITDTRPSELQPIKRDCEFPRERVNCNPTLYMYRLGVDNLCTVFPSCLRPYSSSPFWVGGISSDCSCMIVKR